MARNEVLRGTGSRPDGGKRSPALRIAGLMSGTSLDGVDAALVTISGSGSETSVELERFLTVPLSSDVRESVLALGRGFGGASDLAIWHYRLAEIFAQAVGELLQGESCDVVASHGQTVVHVPGPEGHRATLQLGAAGLIAVRTGTTVVSDFRAGDIAAGGQGAPLVSFVDWLLLRDSHKRRVALNIGGIANVTYLPPLDSDDLPLASDTGPGNAPLDRAIYRMSGETSQMDLNGERAARGRVIPSLLDQLLQHPFLRLPPPKSTGREEFGEAFADDVIARAEAASGAPDDILATLTRFTAVTIANGIRAFPTPGEVVVSGGGRHNVALMRFLRDELGGVNMVPSDRLGLPGDAKEAVAFAVLANQTLRGLPGNVPSCTGARHEVVLGSITPGANYRELMAKLWP